MSDTTLQHDTVIAHEHGYYGYRTSPITGITIHHAAAPGWSGRRIAESFQNPSRYACSNYCIGTSGDLVLSAYEYLACGTSGSYENDNRCITIEVANESGAPEWKVSDAAMNTLIELCTDICKRNAIKELNYTGNAKGNLTMHSMFAATACPGPYLKSKFSYIAEQVNKKLSAKKLKSNVEIAREVNAGWWGDTLYLKKYYLKQHGYGSQVDAILWAASMMRQGYSFNSRGQLIK